MAKARRFFLFVAALFALLAVVCAGVVGPCWRAWLFEGVLVETCPTGHVRPVAHVRTHELGHLPGGRIDVGVTGQFLGPYGPDHSAVRRFSAALSVKDPAGKVTELVSTCGWKSVDWEDARGAEIDGGSWQSACVTLPEGPDGDWTLTVTTNSPAGDATVDATLPVYAPALAHVLTDAPLYKPGQTIRFRAVLLHEGDLTPLASRAGTWRVYDPSGELLLEERGSTSAMGVAASTFPLTADAEAGLWRVEFRSGAATDEAQVEVRAFQLPRFTIEAKSEAAWWTRGDSPVVSGTVRYTSGAPVTSAPVTVRISPSGEWPPPTEWLADRTLVTDRDGRFRLALPPVPADLNGIAHLAVALQAQDAEGAVARGGSTVTLSADPIDVSAVTELADGVVPDTNNRLFVRVTRPDGAPVRGGKVRLQRAWDPGDPGLVADADADGVARFQVDPGQPTTVTVPAQPIRRSPADVGPRVTVDDARDALAEDSLGVEERVTVDRWRETWEGCADRGTPRATATGNLIVRIDPSGAVRSVLPGDGDERDPLAACLIRTTRGLRGPTGRDRVWTLRLSVRDPEVPWLEDSVTRLSGSDGAAPTAMEQALREARPCVHDVREALSSPTVWMWETTKGAPSLTLSPLPAPGYAGRLDGPTAACVARALTAARLEGPATESTSGLLRVAVRLPDSMDVPVAEPTTFPGFAFHVTAFTGDEKVGTTTLRMHPGTVPSLRLRFSDVLVDPGATVELTAIRGPGWSGTFPKKLDLMQGDQRVLEFDFDPDKRVGSFTLPKDRHGFVSVSYGGARALLYVRATNELAVTVASDRAVYRPGESATLTVTTKDAGGPVRAGVTLSGVDATLAALAPLPAPDAFSRITVTATSDSPAFGVLDARALQTGQIAGDNAAQAAVLRVSSTPGTPPGEVRIDVDGHGTFDRDGEATEAFYGLYGEVRAAVRTWEKSAPAGEVMTPKTMVALWERTLDAHPTEDPFGNPLHLSLVPHDLLGLTDPRVLVADGARLPEDNEDWSAYVAREAP